MTRVPTRKGDCARRIRQAVKADMRAGDLVSAGELARDRHRHLVGIGAGFAEEAFLERARHDAAEARRELDLLNVVMAAVGVDHRVGGLLDRRDDGRMVVPESGTHLTRIEVEILLAGEIRHGGPARGDEDRALRRPLVHAGAEAEGRRVGEQGLFVVR